MKEKRTKKLGREAEVRRMRANLVLLSIMAVLTLCLATESHLELGNRSTLV